MFCPKCGKELPNNAAFCSSCGKQFAVSENTYQHTQNAEASKHSSKKGVKLHTQNAEASKHSSKKGVKLHTQNAETSKRSSKKGVKLRVTLIVVSIFLILVLGTGGYFFYQYYTSPEQELLRSLASGNYTEAVRIYNRNYKENDDVSDDVLNTITNILDEEYAAFVNNEKTYSAVCNDIESIAKMNIAELEEKITDIQASVDALNESRTAFETGNQYMESGDYENAILEYEKVISDDSNYTVAQENMETCTDAYRTSILEEAAAKAESDNLNGAVTVLKSGLQVLKNDSELTQKMTLYQNQLDADARQAVIDSAVSAADKGNYTDALSTLTKALNNYPDDSEINNLYNDYEEIYVNAILEEVNALVDSGDYSAALSKLTTAQTILPSNTTLKETYDTVYDDQPVALSEMTIRNSDNLTLESETTVTDFDGEIYLADAYDVYTTYYGKSYWRVTSAEFNLNGAYSRLTGILAPRSSFSEDGGIMVEIYGDDELIDSYLITQKTEAFAFDVSVENVKWLKIKTSSVTGYSDCAVSVIIAKTQLFK